MTKLLFLVAEDWHFVSHRLHLAVAARQAGFEVAVATRHGGQRDVIEQAGIRTLPFAIRRGSLNPFQELATLWRLVWLLRREKPDLLHLVALKPVLLGGLAARLAGVRHIVAAITGLGFLFTAGGRFPLLVALIRHLLPWIARSGVVVVQNPTDAALIAECGVAPAGIRLIPGAGVDTVRFAATPEPAGPPVVMLPARLLLDKGVGEFAEAARRLRADGVVARFVLVGAPDPENPTSVTMADLARWTDEKTLEWWGQRDDMPETLGQASLVCLPSYREGLPKSVLEAMAAGRAVVATDAPGCRDAVSPGETGLLVPVRDAGALAEAIRSLLDDPERRRRMGERGRELAVERFGQGHIAAATLAVYRALLA